MRWIFRILTGILAVLVLLAIGLYLTGNAYLFKGIRATYIRGEVSATIDDKLFFNQRSISTAENTAALPYHDEYGVFSLSNDILLMLEKTQASAFIILKSDSIIYESYPLSEESFTSNSFSMAKTVVTLLAQIAHQNEIINWNDKLIDYIPELDGEFSQDVELWHLSTMTAGLRWEEHYKNPFSTMAKAYYGKDIAGLVLREPIQRVPGKAFEYRSGVTQLLAITLMRATGKSLSEYASEALWKPLGTEASASWHLDNEDGIEMAYCCINARARDYARLGMMVKNHGRVGDVSLIDSAFIAEARKPFLAPQYGWSFWVSQRDNVEVGYFRGVWGQFIIPIPEKDVVIVRLGKQHLAKSDGIHPDDVHRLIDFAMEAL